MDRIFINRLTGEMILSVENGMMREDATWTQVGTFDMYKAVSAAGPQIPTELKGRLTLS